EQWLRHGTPFWSVAVPWYVGDAFGLVVLLPLLITARLRDFRAMLSRPQLAGTLLALSGLILAIAVNLVFRNYPLAYLFFPTVLLLTFTRGFAGGTLGVLVADAYLLLPTLAGHSETIPASPMRDQVMIILGFAAVLSFTVVLTGTALAHRRRLERGLALALGRAEEAVEEAVVAKDAAENANRSKSMFLANMSHELRTPLNAVIGFSEVMKSEMFGPLGHSHYRDYAGLIHDAGSHLLDLINDVLDMSKIEAGKFEIEKQSIDAVSVVEDCLRLMQERARAGGVRLLREIPDRPLMLLADRRAFKQILLNLLSNAVKFTPQEGAVTVTLRRDPLRRTCVLTVRDTGVGIPREAISRLGNPFVQARGGVATTHQGTGLGLALVRALSQMHDGTLRIESDVGAGTLVTVELPLGLVQERAA
ncbi:MAG: MASE1 domain-containing protein, partial [Alphaproteobacteria bacterium]|nr:MASE1 domain-containing protein [Alphaproteobacteria bacterium]